jgi:phage terminase large subunit GpA-like protein
VFRLGAYALQGLAAVEAEQQGAAVTMMEWQAKVPEPGYGPLDFDRFPFQREWYSEEVARAAEVVLAKSTQIGASAYSWRWALRQADQFGDRTLYIFPTLEHVKDFGDQRIEPAIEASEYLRSKIRPKWVKHKTAKRIGRGWLLLRGSRGAGTGVARRQGGTQQRAAGAQSVAAQSIVFDEYDDLEPKNVAQLERRISGAKAQGKMPRIRRLGVPTIPGHGIDELFKRSDQRHWHVVCEECGEDQTITWEENVRWRMPGCDHVFAPGRDLHQLEEEERAKLGIQLDDPKVVGEVWRVCKSCSEPIDVAKGRWVAHRPNASTIGFHASRLIVPDTDLQEIVRNSRKTQPHEVEAFENNDLGRAFSPSESSLSIEAITRAASKGLRVMVSHGEYTTGFPRTMGLDVAGERDMHCRISEQLAPEEGAPRTRNPRRARCVSVSGMRWRRCC